MRLRSWRRSWEYLPLEIRILILGKLANQKHPGWASLASVCKEWQDVLEKINFHKISLQVSCLDDFALLSPQTRKLVHHIYFRVELPRYTYKCCSKRRSRLIDINPIVTDAISKLFSILSSWEPAGNLALELNVYSPSDCEHWFKNIHLSSDNVDHEEDATPTTWTDPQHGWFHGQQVEDPPDFAIQRLFKPIRLNLRESLPQVKAVTRLIIRRQLRRCISVGSFARMFRKLNHLEQISYEPWAPYDDDQRDWENQVCAFGMRHLPDTHNSLTIFEDSYRFYDRYPSRSTPMVWHDSVDSSNNIQAVLASHSLKLQHLSISFMVNAETFFRQCQSTWAWPRMQSLALTSKLLRHEAEDHDSITDHRSPITDLLRRAGVLAQQMPMIHTFVLWNCEKAHACAFIYRVERGTASVTWRGTWKLKLQSHVVNEWQVVASKRRMHRSELQLKQEDIKAAIRCPGDAIYHLKLPCQVIEPTSLWQIRREGHTIWW
ncbi:hypothetical protein THAR02_01221 [Trichoderma harzianum]|uniref:DUF6546 domain-containing protein n=1 Tax=Trichoderma harzianum TaxID=5544 RepID=A0A0G0AQ48_TRIHA|nr:hypothetical protein THAR02_01221 [Trichoderma harzianum]